MKKFILILLATLSINVASAQWMGINGSWNYGLSEPTSGWAYTYASGIVVEKGDLHSQFDSSKVDLTFLVELSGEGDTIYRLDGTKMFVYDNSGKENFISIEVAVDNGTIRRMHGKVNSDNWVEINGLKGEGYRVYDLADDMRVGNTLYMRIKGAGKATVLKFPLNGFTKGFYWVGEKFENTKSDNPFNSTKDDNPFQG